MATPTKTVYENFCRICFSKKITSKLSVIVTKSGEKTDTGKKLQNYCGLFITPNDSRHICLCCKKKLDNSKQSTRVKIKIIIYSLNMCKFYRL